MVEYPLHIPNFLTETSRHVPRGGWCKSVIIDDRGRVRRDPMRTSEQRRLFRSSEVLRSTLERVSEMQEADLLPNGVRYNGESSLVRYKPGQAYGPHGDAAGMEAGREWTVLVCMQSANKGGETRFVNLGRTYALASGDALVWPNYDASGG